MLRKLKLGPDGRTPENRTSEMAKKNPAQTTPFVELEDGTFLSESLAIVRYLDAITPDKEGESKITLVGNGPREQAEVDMWQRRVEHQIVSHPLP